MRFASIVLLILVAATDAPDPLAHVPPPAISVATTATPPPLGLAPIPGKFDLALPFPPALPATPPPSLAAAPPLLIVQVSPQGEDAAVDRVDVTFDQPMVPLAEVSKVRVSAAPLLLEPRPEGDFRWLDPTTLRFEGTFPIGTAYTARVPAGTRSATGLVLTTDFTWSFEARRPEVVRWSGGDRPGAPIRLVFNARMDAALARDAITLSSERGPAELEVLVAKEDRGPLEPREKTLVLRPRKALGEGVSYELTLQQGLRSAEGPLGLREEWRETIRFEPMRFTGVECGPGCPADSWVHLRFNRQLADMDDATPLVTITPRPKGPIEVQAFGSSLQVFAAFAPLKTYRFTVSGKLRSEDGEALGRAQTRSATFGHYAPTWSLEGRHEVSSLDLAQRSALFLDSVNVAELHAVTSRFEPWRIPQFQDARDAAAVRALLSSPPVADLKIAGKTDDRPRETALPLGPAPGVFLVQVTGPAQDGEEDTRSQVVQLTRLALQLAVADERLTARVTTLTGAAPVAGARVEFVDPAGLVLTKGETDATGLASLDRAPWESGGTVIARVGDDMVAEAFSKPLRPDDDHLRATIFTDRGIYKPGELVHATVVLRREGVGPRGDLELATDMPVTCALQLPFSERSIRVPSSFSKRGRATLEVAIPAGSTLGRAFLVVVGGGRTLAQRSFQISEFRSPDFKVSLNVPDRAAFLGDSPIFGVEGRYLFGAPMRDASVQWQVVRGPFVESSPAFPDFHFGWNGDRPRVPDYWAGVGTRESVFELPDAHLADDGSLTTPVPISPDGLPHGSATFQVTATVVDANHQAASASRSIVAHRASRNVGLRLPSWVAKAGEPFLPEVVVTDLEGRAIAGSRVRLELSPDGRSEDPRAPKDDPKAREVMHLSSRCPARVRAGGREACAEYEELLTELADQGSRIGVGDEEQSDEPRLPRLVVSRCETVSAAKPVSCALKAPTSGRFIVQAFVTDPEGRRNDAASPIWLTGLPIAPQEDEPTLELIADRPLYAPGERATLTIQSSFASATGVFVVAREGLERTVPIRIEQGTATVTLDVREEWMPGVTLRAIVGAETRLGPKSASASMTLEVSTASRLLNVRITPDARVVRPGGDLTVTIETTDQAGRPVAADVTLMAVDEGVLSLTNFQVPDLLDAFFRAPRDAGTDLSDTRANALGVRLPESSYSRLGLLSVLGGVGGLESAGIGDLGRQNGLATAIRSRFEPTAFYDGHLETDATGRAQRTFRLPDGLTEYRLTAVALDDVRRFGAGVSRVTTHQPLIVRPALPRFLNVGDRFDAAALVLNDTDASTELVVQLRAANAAIEAPRQHFTLGAREQREVRFAAKAGVPGPAVFQFAASTLAPQPDQDVVELTLPVHLPATAEAFAVYGSTETAVALPLVPPAHTLPGWGGLDVQLASTAALGLTDAALELADYPYECTEQQAARLVGLSFLRGKAVARKADKAEVEALTERIARTVQSLAERGKDGHFEWWPGVSSFDDDPFLTAWVVQALELAALDPTVEELTSNALATLERDLHRTRTEGPRLDPSRAFAALILTRHGKDASAELKRLAAQPLPIFARAWVYEAAALAHFPKATLDELHRQIANAAKVSAGELHLDATLAEEWFGHSEERTEAIVLSALLAAAPDDPMIEKLLRGLLGHRRNGAWRTTQSNAFALVAVQRAFERFEKDTPAFDARVWLGAQPIAGRRFEGREDVLAKASVPLAALTPGNLVLAKEGPGRLYWRAGLRYATLDVIQPESRGFSITRTYAPEAARDSVRRDPDGSWHVRQGSVVKVTVRLTSPDHRHHVALVDPIPAGFEIVDPDLATTRSRGFDFARFTWSHVERHDDRVLAFANDLRAGEREYTWLARATATGTFTAPPAHAEEMYAPETFGRAASDVVVVEP